MKTVLIIDDNHDYREVFREILEEHDVEVFESDCPDAAYELLATIEPPDLIVCDLHMPFTFKKDAEQFIESREVGIKTAQELQWVYPDTSVIALTASDPEEMPQVKSDLSPIPAYQKPVGYKDLLELVHCFLVAKDFGGLQ
jgi:CheY-like chemotaxis protein